MTVLLQYLDTYLYIGSDVGPVIAITAQPDKSKPYVFNYYFVGILEVPDQFSPPGFDL